MSRARTADRRRGLGHRSAAPPNGDRPDGVAPHGRPTPPAPPRTVLGAAVPRRPGAVVAAPSAADPVKQRSQRPTIPSSRSWSAIPRRPGVAALEASGWPLAFAPAARGETARKGARDRTRYSEGLVASVFRFTRARSVPDVPSSALGTGGAPGLRWLGEEGADPPPALAAAAAWRPIQDDERRADLPDGAACTNTCISVS